MERALEWCCLAALGRCLVPFMALRLVGVTRASGSSAWTPPLRRFSWYANFQA